MLTSLVAGLIIGLIAGALTSDGDRRGCLATSLLGLAGAWIGQWLFGEWGPQLAGMAVLPSVLGAILLTAIFGSKK